MSELQDDIRAFGADRLAALLAGNPDFAVLNLMWGTPEEIEPALTKIGFTSVAGVLAWVRNVNAAVVNIDAFVNLIDPPVPVTLAGMPKVGIDVIHKAITEQAMLTADFDINQSDKDYYLPTKAQLDMLAALCPVGRRKWTAETFDCDDFANAFRGWLAMHGLGAMANGYCGILNYDSGGSLIGGHAVVLCMDDTRKLWFLDPQTKRIYSVNYPKLGGAFFGASVRIVLANF